MDIIGGHEREGVGHLQSQRRSLLVGVVRLAEGVHPGDGRESLVGATIIEGFHRCEFHGLYLAHALGRLMSGGPGEQGGNESYPHADLHTLGGKFRMAVLHEIPAADGHAEDGTDDPRRNDGVTELVDGKG